MTEPTTRRPTPRRLGPFSIGSRSLAAGRGAWPGGQLGGGISPSRSGGLSRRRAEAQTDRSGRSPLLRKARGKNPDRTQGGVSRLLAVDVRKDSGCARRSPNCRATSTPVSEMRRLETPRVETRRLGTPRHGTPRLGTPHPGTPHPEIRRRRTNPLAQERLTQERITWKR